MSYLDAAQNNKENKSSRLLEINCTKSGTKSGGMLQVDVDQTRPGSSYRQQLQPAAQLLGLFFRPVGLLGE